MQLIDLQGVKIHLYNRAIDMRKGINGLVSITSDILAKDPQSGDLFIFCNKTRDKVKLIFWHCNGFVLFHKRLQRGKFHIDYQQNDADVVITDQQIKALIMGMNFNLLGEFKLSEYSDFF